MPIAAASLRAPVQRSATATPAGPALALAPRAQAAAAPGASSQLPALPVLPVARQAAAAATAPASATAAPRPAAPAPAPVAEIRPIAGANPIRTAIALQREAADDLEDEGDDDAGLPSPWWGPAEATPRSGSAGAGVSDGPAASIQRLAASPGTTAAPSFGATGRQPAPAESGARYQAAVQRVAGPAARSAPPVLTLPHAAGFGSPRTSVSTSEAPAAAASPTRSIVADPVVQTSPARPSGSGPSGSAGYPAVQRDGTVPISAPTPVPPAGPTGVGPGGGGGAGGTGSGPAGPTSGHSERDLDELAQALFGRIRGRLRSDLIYDREAKGLTFDNV
jgi:hypothetical protein